MVTGIESVFPRLQGTDWRISSERDDLYNCVAWAARDTSHWWWPVGPGKTYWPQGVPRQLSLEAFRAAFATLGYVPCSGRELESGFEKIAVFANEQGVPKHAARQQKDGQWTSKLGKMEDIVHALHDLEGPLYGSVVLVMQRPVEAAEGGQG
jgi:hypothetical protein